MKKKTLLLLLFFIFNGCGYQPMYVTKDLNDLVFKNITLIGNKNINRKIINSLGVKEDEFLKNDNELLIESKIVIEETSKNSKGQVTSYKTIGNIKLIIKENNKIIKNKNFIQDFTYSNRENKFELVEYQSEIENNIINKMIEEIIIFINL